MRGHDIYRMHLSEERKYVDTYSVSSICPYQNLSIDFSSSPEEYKYLYDNFLDQPIALEVSKTSSFSFDFSDDSFSQDYKIDLHPSVLRYENKTHFFYERKPFRATVLYKDAKAYSTGRQNFYTFWVPWTIYSISKTSFSDVAIYYSDSELSSLDDVYIGNIFPNSYSDSKICLGMSSSMMETSLGFDYRTRFESFINDYWSGSWNNDLISILSSYSHEIISSVSQGSSDLYPVLSSYLNFTDEILYRMKNYFTFSRFKYLLKRRSIDNYESTPEASSTRFLCFLSVLTLEETLSFFSELKELFLSTGGKYPFCKDLKSLVNSSNSSSYNGYYTSKDFVNSFFGSESTNISSSYSEYIDELNCSFVFIFGEDFRDYINENENFLVKDLSNLDYSISSLYNFSAYHFSPLEQNRAQSIFYSESTTIFDALTHENASRHLVFLEKVGEVLHVIFKIHFNDLLDFIIKVVTEKDYANYTLKSELFHANNFSYGFFHSYNIVVNDYNTYGFSSVSQNALKNLIYKFCKIIHLDYSYYMPKMHLFLKEKENIVISADLQELR